MYSKWVKSGFILAMLLVSMVSLSTAGCPWFIKNDFYTSQCVAIKEVPASKGILANDPAGTKVINPDLIEIDPKYGTISVYEDGSFVYDPSGATALRSGTYVIFKYGANNGFCDAKYLGIAKIQVSCKCMPKDEVCDDGLDNDCDGLIDGDDDDCGCGHNTCETGYPVCDSTCIGSEPGYCFLTTEGVGRCATNGGCGEFGLCDTSADCDEGEVCVTETCCGITNCLPLCSAGGMRISTADGYSSSTDGPTNAGK
jgi:hypothetical protein